MNEELNNLLSKIKGRFYCMEQEAKQVVEKGNKSAGARSRKASSELTTLLKQWRAESIAAEKVSRP